MVLRNGEVRVLDFGAARTGDDVFGLACLAYELLAGRQPFRRQPATQGRHRARRPQRIPGLSRRQWRTLSAGLESNPGERPCTLREWLAGFDLEQAVPRLPALDTLETQPVARRGLLLPAMLAALSLLLVAAAFVMRDDIARLLPLPDHEPGNDIATVDALPRPVAGVSPAGTAAPPGADTPLAEAAAIGPGEISFAQETYVVNPGDGAARLVLQRSGGLAGEVDFSWWTEEGTAREGEDFISLGSRSERLRSGESQLIVFIPIVSDPLRRSSEVFHVHLGETRGGLKRGKISRAAVIINGAID